MITDVSDITSCGCCLWFSVRCFVAGRASQHLHFIRCEGLKVSFQTSIRVQVFSQRWGVGDDLLHTLRSFSTFLLRHSWSTDSFCGAIVTFQLHPEELNVSEAAELDIKLSYGHHQHHPGPGPLPPPVMLVMCGVVLSWGRLVTAGILQAHWSE